MMQGELSEYPGYIVHSDGKVYSDKTKKYIGSHINEYDKTIISLKHRNGHFEQMQLDRLIAQVFVENDDIDKKKWIRHIDGNKLNNDYKNLQWVERTGDNAPNRTVVCQYTHDGQFIKKYASIISASIETKINYRQISEACKLDDDVKIGKHVKYRWKYEHKFERSDNEGAL
jgi:hypothetical protein